MKLREGRKAVEDVIQILLYTY